RGAGRGGVGARAGAAPPLGGRGVGVVVHGGRARPPRVDHARGLSGLTTVRASRAAGRQRAGRAGREAAGAVYRCWTEAEDGRLTAFPAPEIKVADLTAFALQAACWGDPDASGLALLDPPPGGAMAAARDVLTAVGAVDSAGRATELGVRLGRLGVHPRLGRALLDTAGEGAGVVALLSEEVPRDYGDDLGGALRRARRGGDAYGERWRGEVRRLRAVSEQFSHPPAHDRQSPAGLRTGPGPRVDDGARAGASPDAGAGSHAGAGASPSAGASPNAGPSPSPNASASAGASPNADAGAGAGASASDDRLTGLVAALAFPERVARLDGGSYLMASGTRAEVSEGSALRGAPWIVVAVADRPGGKGHARVRLGAAVPEDVAHAAAGPLLEERDEVHWAEGDLVARRVERLGAIELAVRPLKDLDPALVRGALLEGLRQEGFGLLRWPPEAQALRQRLAFLRAHLGEPWPDVSDEALHARVDEWLEPELSRARRRADLGRVDAGQALARLLPWASGRAARLDELAPERIAVPSGSRVRIDYGDPDRPVLAVKLQEMFGLQETPAVAGVPLLVHLLSPAGRPVAVTADLASFWKDGYRGVRAELRGRYPKHPWPEDPATAEPTRHTNARLRR
ncbi:ATP-dependent helicase C-terminal domain-containing protein, partial [Streptomyces sp. NPDC020800]|uniref:ATP-dependent helicase C-terminal domain-containing protein n=1 Tax=Streptomyces sp. NPDC020800 TaxID=3365092 RepID=UPI0037A53ACE